MESTILVVDDDFQLRTLLHDHLQESGYAVALAEDGAAMKRQLAQQPIDLVILDLMLPGEDGLELCRALRAASNIPILILSARGDEVDRIVGFEIGADDYMPKPFSPRELSAHVKSLLRRSRGGSAIARPARQLRFVGWTLDLEARHLVDADRVAVPLSSGEFRLLKALAENPNRVLSRDQLLDVLARREAGPFERTIDVLVSRLRRRFGEDAREPSLIITVRNEGYLFSADVETLR